MLNVSLSFQRLILKMLVLKVLRIAHFNINSLRNKFDLLADQIKDNVDVLAISETKLDYSFSVGQFRITGHASPFRLDQNLGSKSWRDLGFCIRRYPSKTFII